jgi:hypothetical protein
MMGVQGPDESVRGDHKSCICFLAKLLGEVFGNIISLSPTSTGMDRVGNTDKRVRRSFTIKISFSWIFFLVLVFGDKLTSPNTHSIKNP